MWIMNYKYESLSSIIIINDIDLWHLPGLLLLLFFVHSISVDSSVFSVQFWVSVIVTSASLCISKNYTCFRNDTLQGYCHYGHVLRRSNEHDWQLQNIRYWQWHRVPQGTWKFPASTKFFSPRINIHFGIVKELLIFMNEWSLPFIHNSLLEHLCSRS